MKYKRLAFALTVVFGTCLPVFASSGEVAGGGDMSHKMTLLAIQIGIILFAARLGGMIAEKLKMPGVLGELMIGVAIGPYALGGVSFGSVFAHGVFPLVKGAAFPVAPELYGFCTIASIILLFLAGVETDTKMFMRYSFAGSMVGIGGVVVSFLAGNLCAVWFMPRILGTGPIGFFHPAALFLGIMGTATSVGITARILSEQKRIDSEEGVTTMAGAVVDDVLGIIVLAIALGVIGAQSGEGGSTTVDWLHIGKIAAKAFGIWLGATIVGFIAAQRISTLLKLFGSRVPIAIMSLGLALILAGFFETMGLAMIIGAYVMGLALSRTDIRYVIEENLLPIYTFMVPIFFCVMGMMVDCSLVFTKPVLIFGSIYTLLAIAAKVIGCSIPAMLCGFNFLGSMRISAGMVPRGEVALIIASIGLSKGVLKPDVFGIGILMTLVTTLIAPPMLVALFKNGKSGLRHPEDKGRGSQAFSFEMPSGESARVMCDKLILEFRREGFFTHLLSHSDLIWKVRRDDVEIGIRRDGNAIHFECSPEEERFIATAILEVTAGLTALASELSKPVKTRGVAQMLSEAGAGVSGQEHTEMGRFLNHFVMIPDLKVETKDEALHQLVTILYQKGLVANLEETYQKILSREAILSTGLEHGIAVPHIRTDDVSMLIGAVALVPGGIKDYTTLDDSEVKILVMTISPTDAQTPHLRLIAHIAQVLDTGGRTRLLATRTEQEMHKIFLRQP